MDRQIEKFTCSRRINRKAAEGITFLALCNRQYFETKGKCNLTLPGKSASTATNSKSRSVRLHSKAQTSTL